MYGLAASVLFSPPPKVCQPKAWYWLMVSVLNWLPVSLLWLPVSSTRSTPLDLSASIISGGAQNAVVLYGQPGLNETSLETWVMSASARNGPIFSLKYDALPTEDNFFIMSRVSAVTPVMLTLRVVSFVGYLFSAKS